MPVTTLLPAFERIEDIDDLVTIEAEPFPDWITIAGGKAWVANVSTGVVGYDLVTADPVADVPIGTDVCMAMDASSDALWVGDCGDTTLVRIDTADGSVAATIALPFDSIAEESSVAASADSVWVLSGGAAPEIARVDQATNAVVGTFLAPAGSAAMRFVDGSLWVSDAVNGVVHRLDPTTGDEIVAIEAGTGARFMAVGAGGLWVMNNAAGTVTFIEPETNIASRPVVVSERPINGGDIAVGGAFVYVRVSDVAVAMVSPDNLRVVARFGPSFGSGSVAADDNGLWISAHDVHRVWRIGFDQD